MGAVQPCSPRGQDNVASICVGGGQFYLIICLFYFFSLSHTSTITTQHNNTESATKELQPLF